MQTKAKTNSVVTHALSADGTQIQFNVLGVTHTANEAGALTAIPGARPLVVDMNRLADAVRVRAAIHGMIQRVSDAAAIARTKENNYTVSAQERYDAMAELVEHYMTGTDQWRLRASERTSRDGLLLQALCEAYPNKSRDALSGWLKKQSQATRLSLQNDSPLISPIYNRLVSEQTDSVDGDALAGELESL